jgi:hypothetical protein
VFDVTSDRWTNATLSQARDALAATSVGEIVAFGGGWDCSTLYSVVDMFNVTSNIWFSCNSFSIFFLFPSKFPKQQL